MKTKIVLSVLLVLAVAIFYFSKPNAKENSITNLVSSASTSDTVFRIGAYWDGMVIFNYDSLKEMNLNLWHITSGINDGWTGAGVDSDYRYTPLVNYGHYVKGRIDRNYSEGNLKTIMDRPKINYLGYGKRSDYECDTTSKNSNYWFYTFRDHNLSVSNEILDNSQFGSNNTYVRYSQKNVHDTGYVMKRLISNREQTSFAPGENVKWHIMPRIRINPEDTLTNKLVCRIDILRYDSSLIKSVEVKTWNFKDATHPYNGKYLEQYFFSTNEGNLDIDSTGVFNPGHKMYTNDTCGVDFRVWWAGECDMWIDRIRVENQIAYDLFHDNPDSNGYLLYQNWLTWEAQNIAGAEVGKAHYFLFDEPEFATLPCLAYLNKKIIQLSGGTSSLVPVFSRNNFKAHLPHYEYVDFSGEQLKTFLIDTAGFQMFSFDCYPLFGWVGTEYCYLPNTLPYVTNYNAKNGQLGMPVSPSQYENWIQNYFDDTTLYLGADRLIKSLKYGYELYKQYNLPFSTSLQTHLNNAGDGQLREPINEEIAMMTNVAVSYGAKEIMYFVYGSYGKLPVPDDEEAKYCRGIAEWKTSGLSKRDTNVYKQNKWEGVKAVTTKLTKWGPKLMSFTNTNTNSYIYRNPTERGLLNSNSYFIYFATLKPGSGTPDCGNQEYTPDNIPQGYTYDCADSTYLQIATFKNSEPNTEYFMVVNRRCSPYKDELSEDNRGGKRKIRAVLHSDYSSFPDSANMSIYDCEKDSVVAVFKTHNPLYVELGWFMPGEGKLFKIVPITETGGTLVGDEYLNSNVTIKKSIYNNGYNITFGPNANVSFEDSAGIYMNGGVLKIGNASQTYGTNLQIKGASGNKKWQGLVLDECDTVLIYGATFSNILSGQPAINMTNCYNFKIMNSLFNCGSNENSGGIYADYNESPGGENDSVYQYIGYNVFSFNESSNNVIQVVSTASPEIPLIIEGNQFNTGAGSVSSSGIFLSNITGGAIKNNEITNYINGIILVSSSCDFFENLISSNQENTKAIQLKLGDGDAGPSQGYFTGGYNGISTLGSSSMNIDVANSYFNIDEGYNVFDIDFSNSQRHISGYFPSSSETEYRAGYNCFKNNSSEDTSSIFVTQGNEGSRITFNTSPTYCSTNELEDYQVFSLPGGINDTVYYRTGGSGGGYKDGQAMAIETSTSYKYLRDSININIRKRNYIQSESQCKHMLLAYPDSNASISAIFNLYLSSLMLDSAGNHIQITKSFYENLILNNPNNTPLIKRSNYFVQKCKVALKQYASALQGFQEIINQNPYSYEGLIASWDYAATTLLMGSGGENNDELRIMNDELKDKREECFDDLHTMLDSLRSKKPSINSYSTENYDTKKFTKQDREVINTNVENAFKDERTKQVEKLIELEKKITTLSNSTPTSKYETKINDNEIIEAKKELKTLRTLGEVVKAKKPKNIIEHKLIVNADIKKVFGTDKIAGKSNTNNLLPQTYSLSQNYPNPFNPNTKINYELPKDGKVKLVIYDILGREIKTLVNELKQAGRYTIEFNGSNYASGVYFYRIQVEGGKSFTAVKKMVLIK